VWVCVCVGFVMCGCVYVWVCVCVGVCMCGCSDNCMSVLVLRVLVFTVFCIVCTVFFVLFRLCIFILICFINVFH
jgi:hypothetical protein